jgi:hypothetical protein
MPRAEGPDLQKLRPSAQATLTVDGSSEARIGNTWATASCAAEVGKDRRELGRAHVVFESVRGMLGLAHDGSIRSRVAIEETVLLAGQCRQRCAPA